MSRDVPVYQVSNEPCRHSSSYMAITCFAAMYAISTNITTQTITCHICKKHAPTSITFSNPFTSPRRCTAHGIDYCVFCSQQDISILYAVHFLTLPGCGLDTPFAFSDMLAIFGSILLHRVASRETKTKKTYHLRPNVINEVNHALFMKKRDETKIGSHQSGFDSANLLPVAVSRCTISIDDNRSAFGHPNSHCPILTRILRGRDRVSVSTISSAMCKP